MDAPVADLIEDGRAGAHHEIGIESGVGVVLNAIILPAQSEVGRKARRDIPRILTVEREIVVAVVALKCRRSHRKG